MAKSSTTDTLRRTGQPLFFTMRTIVITHDGFWYTIEDWNFARWKLYESTQGRYYCDMHGIKVTFESVEHFLELMYGHSRVGEFVNYEIEIKESGR
ncbi:MAG: hypothetical protein ACLS6N_06050 [Alistipes finegoldii]